MSKYEKARNMLKTAYEELNQLNIEIPSLIATYGEKKARSIIKKRYKNIEKLRKIALKTLKGE